MSAHCAICGSCTYKLTGLRGVLTAPAATWAGRVRLWMQGIHAPRTAGRATWFRAGDGAGPHRAPLAIPVPRRVAGDMQPCVPVRLRSVPVRLRSPRLLSCESHAKASGHTRKRVRPR